MKQKDFEIVYKALHHYRHQVLREKGQAAMEQVEAVMTVFLKQREAERAAKKFRLLKEIPEFDGSPAIPAGTEFEEFVPEDGPYHFAGELLGRFVDPITGKTFITFVERESAEEIRPICPKCDCDLIEVMSIEIDAETVMCGACAQFVSRYGKARPAS